MLDKQRQRVIEIIRSILPDDAIIIILSETGSRAFGWGSEKYDIDVRAVIACQPYWDTFHIGEELFDTNCEELKHFIRSVNYRYWTIFEDLSNPFYIDKRFDFQEFMDFCSAANIKNHWYTTATQLAQLKISPTIRTALHCYRLIMTPLYFLDNGRVEINVRKQNEEYFHSEKFTTLADHYAKAEYPTIDWTPVFEELKSLDEQLKAKLSERTDDLNTERYADWKQRLIRDFY